MVEKNTFKTKNNDKDGFIHALFADIIINIFVSFVFRYIFIIMTIFSRTSERTLQ